MTKKSTWLSSAPSSSLIVDALRAGKTCLVGLDRAKEIVGNRVNIRVEAIPAYGVTHAVPPSKVPTLWYKLHLICSKSMAENDAYWLAQAMKGYLQEQSVNDGEPAKIQSLYEQHPGAKLLHDGGSPWYVMGTRSSLRWFLGAITAFLATVVSTVLGSVFLRKRTAITEPEPQEKQPAKPAPSAKSGAESFKEKVKKAHQSPKLPPAKDKVPDLLPAEHQQDAGAADLVDEAALDLQQPPPEKEITTDGKPHPR